MFLFCTSGEGWNRWDYDIYSSTEEYPTLWVIALRRLEDLHLYLAAVQNVLCEWEQSHPLYGQLAYRIQPRRVRLEPVVLAGLILEFDIWWAQEVLEWWLCDFSQRTWRWENELSGEIQTNRVSTDQHSAT